jgi:hypothetical protein
MTNLKNRLVFLGKILAVSFALAVLLLIAGHQLFSIVSPLKLLLCAGVGVLLLIAVVAAQSVALGWSDVLSLNEVQGQSGEADGAAP